MTESLDLSSEETDFLLRAKEKGWVLVPEEPTAEMIRAGASLLPDDFPLDEDAQTVYAAMIDAKP